jgi:hypothetical protein
MHHLGPRYCGNFQDPELIRFFTYEAATSLNMFLSGVTAKNLSDITPLLKVVKDGMSLSESSIVFSITPHHLIDQSDGTVTTVGNRPSRESPNIFKVEGDVFAVKVFCLDLSLWKIGGAAVALRLIQLARVSNDSVSWIAS